MKIINNIPGKMNLILIYNLYTTPSVEQFTLPLIHSIVQLHFSIVLIVRFLNFGTYHSLPFVQ